MLHPLCITKYRIKKNM